MAAAAYTLASQGVLAGAGASGMVSTSAIAVMAAPDRSTRARLRVLRGPCGCGEVPSAWHRTWQLVNSARSMDDESTSTTMFGRDRGGTSGGVVNVAASEPAAQRAMARAVRAAVVFLAFTGPSCAGRVSVAVFSRGCPGRPLPG